MTNPPQDGDDRDAGSGEPQADPDQSLTQPVEYPSRQPIQPYGQPGPGQRGATQQWPAGPDAPRPYGPPQQFGQPPPGSPQPYGPRYGDPSQPYGQPGYAPGYGQQYGQPGYPPPGHDQPPYGQPAYGQPAYGQPAYGQPAYGRPQYGPQTGGPGSPYGATRTKRSPLRLLLGLITLALLLVLAVVLANWLGPTVLDAGAVERDVAAQFEEREGVAIDLSCDEQMVLDAGRSYECTGLTADGEDVTLEITVTDENTGAYTWTEP